MIEVNTTFLSEFKGGSNSFKGLKGFKPKADFQSLWFKRYLSKTY
jgi:hypothetical protein